MYDMLDIIDQVYYRLNERKMLAEENDRKRRYYYKSKNEKGE